MFLFLYALDCHAQAPVFVFLYLCIRFVLRKDTLRFENPEHFVLRIIDVVDNLHGSCLRHSPVKTLKKVLLKYPTFPTPVTETYSVFNGFRVKDRV